MGRSRGMAWIYLAISHLAHPVCLCHLFFAWRDDNRFVKRVAGGRCRGCRAGCLGHGDHPVPRPATRNYGNCFRHCHSAVAHSDCADYYHCTGRARWVAFATKNAAGGTHIATHHNFPSSRHWLLDSILCAPAWTAHPAPVTQNQAIAVFDTFFRVGSLVFGGGHVVLPVLQREVV